MIVKRGPARWRIPAGLTAIALPVLALATTIIRGQASPVVRTIEMDQTVDDVAMDTSSGRVFIDTSHGNDTAMRVLDTRTGMLVRTIHAPDGPAELGVSARTGHLFAAHATTYTASVRMLDLRSGALLHTVPIDPNPIAVLVQEQVGRVYVASAGAGIGDAHGCSVPNSSVSILDTRSGLLLRRIHLTTGVNAIAVDERAGRAVVTSDNHCFMGPFSIGVLDVTSGRLPRTIPIPLRPTRVVMDEATGRAFVLTATPNPFGPTPNIGRVFVLNVRTGALIRSIPLGSPPTDIAVDERTGRVFVAVGGPSRIVSYTFPPANTGTSGSGMMSGSGMTRMATGLGTVQMLDARSGIVLRAVPVGVNPEAVAVDARRGRIFVVNAGSTDGYATSGPTRVTIKAFLKAPGSVSLLDATTGTVSRTITLDTSPHAIAVDDAAGHAFVINYGSGVPLPIPDPWAWAPSWLRQRIPFAPPSSRTRIIPSSVSILDTTR